MNREEIRQHLIRLRNLIREEREFAKVLDVEGMSKLMEEKESLIVSLNNIEEVHPDDIKYAQEIKEENRRNAFLFRSTLNWIQDTMEFFGRTATPIAYGQQGSTVSFNINGRLLSGRI
jgi:flagellar biosynthesis/type III secretory pathway chaperone